MSDVPISNLNGDCENNQPTQSFCVDVPRVYDSCSDKDCLKDLRVFFTEENQNIINSASSIRIREANIISTNICVSPVTYHNGFYSVDMTFYFEIVLDVNGCQCQSSSTVNGLSVYTKRVILFGGDGRVSVFTSDVDNQCTNNDCANLPKAKVQVAQPMALNAVISNNTSQVVLPANIPQCVLDYFGEDFVQATSVVVLATIGIFTIVQLERNVQLMVPAFDFCLPCKECVSTTDNPCDMFSKIDFPKDQFFPPNLAENNCDTNYSCKCSD